MINGTMKPSILLVEDEAALVTLLTYNLEKAGFDVRAAMDGDEGLTMIAERLPDLVVLDWMLPGLSGIELCRRLRAREDTERLPVIMLTARGEENDRVRGLDRKGDMPLRGELDGVADQIEQDLAQAVGIGLQLAGHDAHLERQALFLDEAAHLFGQGVHEGGQLDPV